LGTNNKRVLGDYYAYDNSVYYNDYVVNSLLETIQNQTGVSAFLYFSDHSEDIAHHRGHTSRPESFTFPMLEIPMLAWLSPEYIQRYPNTYKVLSSHKNKLFSNDMIYETLIGLSHIKTDHYTSAFDLSSTDYKLDAKDAVALHGNIRYADKKNFFFWQKRNTKILKDSNLSNKIVISGANSVGKLEDAWRLGYRSFQLDLFYLNEKGKFQIGTDKYETGGDVSDVLGYFDISKIEHIFLSLNNVSQFNMKSVIGALEKIQHRLSFKNKVILMVKEKKLIKALQDKGWKMALNSEETENKSSADYFLLENTSVDNIGSKHIILAHVLNLAEDSFSKKLEDNFSFLEKKNIRYVFMDFESEYQE